MRDEAPDLSGGPAPDVENGYRAPDGPGDDPRTEVFTFSFEGPVKLAVDQESPGPVVVTGGERNEVLVRATKQVRSHRDPARARRLMEETAVSVDVEGDHVTVRTEGCSHHCDFWGDNKVAVFLDISVPRGSSVDVDSGSGRVQVRDTFGPVWVDCGSGGVDVARARGGVSLDVGSGPVSVEETEGGVSVDSGSGSVVVRRIGGAVEVDGSSGPVSVSEVEGPVEVKTGSGTVRLNRIIGDVSVDSGSGSVKLDLVRGRRVSVDTGSGSIEADFDVERSGDYDFDTGSGRITLVVPDGASMAVEADSGSGPIECELPLNVTHIGRTHLAGTVDDASARVRADTSSGRIVIRRRSVPGFDADGDQDRPRVPGRPRLTAERARLKAENRELVLKMVSEGKLSAEQGRSLLAALDGGTDEEAARDDGRADPAAGDVGGADPSGDVAGPSGDEPGDDPGDEPEEAGDSGRSA